MHPWRTSIGTLAVAAWMAAALPPALAGDITPALVRHAPELDGWVEGSVQMMTGEDVTLEGGAIMIGDLLVPGRPTVRIDGRSEYEGTCEGTGSPSPSRYTITLCRGSALGHVIRRTDPVSLPTVLAPPPPAGRRSVTINRAGQSAGDFATLRNLTLARDVGLQVVPPGAYGNFTANSGSGFVLGMAGAAHPAVYNFQNLTFEDRSKMQVVGPVLVTVACDFDVDGTIGAASDPAWLTLNLFSEGVTIDNGAALYGHVCAPRGAVTVRHNALLIGGVVSDRLTVARGGRLRLLAANHPPTVTLTAPGKGDLIIALTKITLTAIASDADGTISKVEFFDGATKLGTGTPAAGQPAAFSLVLPGGLPAGVHPLTAVATDNAGAATVSAPVSVNVSSAADVPPQVTLTTPASGATLASGIPVDVSANATDADGAIAKVEFFDGATKLGEVDAPTSPPSMFTLTVAAGLAPGSHSLTARATDNAGVFADSVPVSVAVLASLPYLADFEASENYALGSLAGQLGWRVKQGAATVTGDAFFSGSRSVALLPGTPEASIAQAFAPFAGGGVAYVDFYAQPVADADLGAATTFNAGGARFALLRNGTNGELDAFNGDGASGGHWRATAFTAPLAADGHARDWVRFTARLDFNRHTWDLYANGRIVSADLGSYDNTAAALTEFGVQGHATATSRLDYLFAGPQNPLFADVNDNGIDDTWETAHGLSLSSNNRDLSPSGNGVTVIQAFVAGLDPQDFYSGVAPALSWEGAGLQIRRSGEPALLPLAVTILCAPNRNPLPNAPITFSVAAPKAALCASCDDLAGVGQLVVRADANGIARVWLKLEAGWDGNVRVNARVSVGGATGGSLIFDVLPTADSTGLACGADQSLWLDGAGIARAWGRNDQGQLGDGTVLDRSQMRRMGAVPEAYVCAAFGQAHGLAATATGEVFAWGDNYFGQLGDGSASSRRVPGIVTGLSGVVQVAAGDYHSLALCVDGTVWAWGGNHSGQLGDGSHGNHGTPTRISGLENIVRIVAGARHSAALAADGTVWAWGSNEFGQLGDATAVDRPSPAVVAGVDTIVALVSGRQHLLALRTDGTVWAWGGNQAGQLGLGSIRGKTEPQRISALPIVTGLAAGSSHSAALAADGSLWTWGANDVGQLGNSGAESASLPVRRTLSGVRAFAAGWDHVVVQGNDGSLLAWGLNRYGQLGARTEGVFGNVPVPVDPAAD
jgi:alpha-tubulin suppressor-like RCC1 family protein